MFAKSFAASCDVVCTRPLCTEPAAVAPLHPRPLQKADRAHFKDYLDEDFEAYVARKLRDGVHGNNPEIQALSELFNRPVEVRPLQLQLL